MMTTSHSPLFFTSWLEGSSLGFKVYRHSMHRMLKKKNKIRMDRKKFTVARYRTDCDVVSFSALSRGIPSRKVFTLTKGACGTEVVTVGSRQFYSILLYSGIIISISSLEHPKLFGLNSTQRQALEPSLRKRNTT